MDHPTTDKTECDGCGLEVHWLKTRDWSIKFDRCYCPWCARALARVPRARQLPFLRRILSDGQYHGSYTE